MSHTVDAAAVEPESSLPSIVGGGGGGHGGCTTVRREQAGMAHTSHEGTHTVV